MQWPCRKCSSSSLITTSSWRPSALDSQVPPSYSAHTNRNDKLMMPGVPFRNHKETFGSVPGSHCCFATVSHATPLPVRTGRIPASKSHAPAVHTARTHRTHCTHALCTLHARTVHTARMHCARCTPASCTMHARTNVICLQQDVPAISPPRSTWAVVAPETISSYPLWNHRASHFPCIHRVVLCVWTV